MKSANILYVLTFLVIIQITTQTSQLTIPLTYAFNPNNSTKYPIKLSFNSSSTVAPFSSTFLSLYNNNITMQVTQNENNPNEVIIGLKYPSQFLTAIQQTFKIEPRQIQFGKQDYTQLILIGNNYVQSKDQFVNGDTYDVRTMYNFGDIMYKEGQICYLIDDQKVYFDELLILEILNSMEKRNNIKFKQNYAKKIIELQGSLENFPKISFMRGKSILEIEIKPEIINYIPRTNSSESINFIGYKAFKKFSKFEIDENVITFKRTSQLYQLYLFLGYFFAFTLVFIILSKAKLQQSMKFVKSVIDWAVFHNRQARVRVLRTQLQ